ncbi:hypothetical protein FQA39_LY07385 [Lamprigera yunnana]|nr:hypothetical protein FQA39_LY07385 [Lamprigera yunnana]
MNVKFIYKLIDGSSVIRIGNPHASSLRTYLFERANLKEMEEKRKGKNFTAFEKNFLVDLVQSKISIIENKKSDSINLEQKARAWDEIQKSYNGSQQTGFRTTKHLKEVYHVVKRNARTKLTTDRVNNNVSQHFPLELCASNNQIDHSIQEECIEPYSFTSSREHPVDNFITIKQDRKKFKSQLEEKEIENKKLCINQEIQKRQELHKLNVEHKKNLLKEVTIKIEGLELDNELKKMDLLIKKKQLENL